MATMNTIMKVINNKKETEFKDLLNNEDTLRIMTSSKIILDAIQESAFCELFIDFILQKSLFIVYKEQILDNIYNYASLIDKKIARNLSLNYSIDIVKAWFNENVDFLDADIIDMENMKYLFHYHSTTGDGETICCKTREELTILYADERRKFIEAFCEPLEKDEISRHVLFQLFSIENDKLVLIENKKIDFLDSIKEIIANSYNINDTYILVDFYDDRRNGIDYHISGVVVVENMIQNLYEIIKSKILPNASHVEIWNALVEIIIHKTSYQGFNEIPYEHNSSCYFLKRIGEEVIDKPYMVMVSFQDTEYFYFEDEEKARTHYRKVIADFDSCPYSNYVYSIYYFDEKEKKCYYVDSTKLQ